MTIVQEITLDTLREHAVKVITAKQLDENSRFVKVHLRQGGAVLKAPLHSIVTLSVCRADDKAKTFEGKATDDGSVLIQLPNWMLELPGTCSCSITVVDGEEKLSTLNFVVKVEPAPCDNTDITEDESYDILISLINEVKAIRNRNFIFVDIKHLGDSLGFDAKEILDIYHMTNRYIVVDGKEFELRDGDILFVADSAVPTYWVKGDKIYNIEVRKPDQTDITNLLTWQSGVNDGSIVVGRAYADEDGNNIKNTYATQSTTQSLDENKVNCAGDEVSGDYNLTNGSITIVSDADSRSARLSNDGVISADVVDGTSTRFTDGEIRSKFLEDTAGGNATERETILHIPRKDGTLSTYEELDALAKELRHDDEVDRNALQEHIAAYAAKTDTIISRLNVNDENIANAQTSVNRAQHSADNAQNTADRAIGTSEQAVEISNQALSLATEAIAVKSIADEAMEIAVNAKNKSDQIADEAIGILSDVANDLEVALTAEVERAIGADNALSAALDAEIKRAVAAEEILDTAIKTLTDGVKPEEIDGVKDLINYANEHGAEFIQVQKDIATNAKNIETNATDLSNFIQRYNKQIDEFDEVHDNHTNNLERVERNLCFHTDTLIVKTPVFENLTIDTWNETLDTDYIPNAGERFEIVRDGVSYLCQLIAVEYEDDKLMLVPDIFYGESSLESDWGIAILVDERKLLFGQNQGEEHTYSIYQVDYANIPDAELNPESERPIQNKAVAQALANKFDIPVEYEYGSYVPIYRGDIKETGVLPFTDFATPYTVAYRGEDGRVQVGSPSADYDATPKTYVDEKIGDISTAIGKEKIVNDKQQNFLDYLNGVESEGLNIQIDWANSSATVVDAGEFRGENLVIPSHYQGFPVTTIGEQAFYYNSVYAPKRIKIPDTVTRILGGAFQENSAIEEVVLPKNLQHIEGGAFEYFYGKSLIIPKSVATIGGYAFTSSDVTLYIEAESKPDGWSDEWDQMHSGKIVWGYVPDFEGVNKKLIEFENYKSKFNLENGLGENSIQIKNGNAQGKNSVDLSESMEVTFVGDAYTTDYLQANFDNSLSDEEKQRLFPVKRVAYKGWVRESLYDTTVITFGDGSYIRPKDYGCEWVYYSASGERLIAYGDDPSDDSENLYVDVDTYIQHIDVYLYSDMAPDYSEFLEDLGVFDNTVSIYGTKTETTGATADYTFTAGKGTRATKEGQYALGAFNEVDDDALLMLGNGTEEKPSNALVVKRNGEVYAGEHGNKRLLFADELGDISTALDAILAKQNAVIGGTE